MSGTPGTPSRLTTRERLQRDERLRADLASGMTYAEAARRHGVSERQAYRIAADRPEEPVFDLAEINHRDVLSRVLGAHITAMDTLAELARAADSDNARVGAAGRLPGAASSFVDALTRFGLVPPVPGEWMSGVELNEIRHVLAAQIGEFGMDVDNVLRRLGNHPLIRFAAEAKSPARKELPA